MTGFDRSVRRVLAGLLALALAGCSAGPTGDADVGPVDGTAGAGAPVAAGFDIATVPVSDVPLGEFPYFVLPAGYVNPNREVPVRDLDRVAVWTGDRLEWLEGRIFESFVHAGRGKGWSKLELVRDIGRQVAQAGGVEVTQSKPDRDAIKAWDEGQAYSPGRGDIYNTDVATWVVHRADRDIWVHFAGNGASGSWMVVETAAGSR